jgi:phosphonate transport system substrate-binding protein
MRILAFLAVMLLSGCVGQQAQQTVGYVDLSDLQPVVTIEQDVIPLRVAVASVVSPKGTIQSYEPMLKYLESQLHRPVELVQRRTYLETNDLISEGKVDLAFVCTSAYVSGFEEFGMELLAAPQVNGDRIYFSLLIVPSDSTAESMSDLAGKVFAFTDPISLSGRMYPTFVVQQLGYDPETFFSRIFFTYNHDEAIRAVANKLADGAAVDSLVYDFALTRDPELINKVRVIHRSPAFGIPPVVVSPLLDDDIKFELQKILLRMSETAEGRQVLDSIGVEKYIIIDDQAYDDVRELVKNVERNR